MVIAERGRTEFTPFGLAGQPSIAAGAELDFSPLPGDGVDWLPSAVRRLPSLVMADEFNVDVGGEKVRITSPDRVVFPKQGWTKRDVSEHFVTVAEGALRGIFGRPTMLKRYMQDVEHDPVYHKRAAANTPFETVPIVFPSQRPGIMNVPRTEADVLRLAQLGCLDFHPWPSRAEDIDHPDELRLDFDPHPRIRLRPRAKGCGRSQGTARRNRPCRMAQDLG